MQPFENIPQPTAAALKYVLCDIDDTITSAGKLTAPAYAALWRLYEAGIDVVPVTGRPAGWCDMIVRQWPVKAVVGENGAFVNYMEGGQLHTYTHPAVHEDAAEKLAAIRDTVLAAIPDSRVAKDQFARRYDLAIDFAEDPPRLGLDTAGRIRDICLSAGAEAKVSSIHVNTWFGKYDKLDTTLRFFGEILGEQGLEQKLIFFGDSPNDEPMFKHFPICCGVANIRAFQASMKYLPAYVTDLPGGAGFAQAVESLLDKAGR